MVGMLELIIRSALYILPLYITNASELLFGGKTPLDFDKKLGGKPLLGKGKTIKGTTAGLVAGVFSVILIDWFFGEFTVLLHSNYVFFGVLLCLGAIIGDIVASFIKRRIGIRRGGRAPLLDQLDFIAGGLAFSSLMVIPRLWETVLIVFLTLVVHSSSNYIAFKLKMKNVPW